MDSFRKIISIDKIMNRIEIVWSDFMGLFDRFKKENSKGMNPEFKDWFVFAALGGRDSV